MNAPPCQTTVMGLVHAVLQRDEPGGRDAAAALMVGALEDHDIVALLWSAVSNVTAAAMIAEAGVREILRRPDVLGLALSRAVKGPPLEPGDLALAAEDLVAALTRGSAIAEANDH